MEPNIRGAAAGSRADDRNDGITPDTQFEPTAILDGWMQCATDLGEPTPAWIAHVPPRRGLPSEPGSASSCLDSPAACSARANEKHEEGESVASGDHENARKRQSRGVRNRLDETAATTSNESRSSVAPPRAKAKRTAAKAKRAATAPALPKTAGAPLRRLRWSGELPEPISGSAPWAKKRPELAGLIEAEHALLVRRSSAWRELMVPACAAVDAERSKRGLKFLYSSEELELALLFGRACGLRSYKQTRQLLTGDDARSRQLLGFDLPRNQISRPETGRRMRRMDGVPSEATISRHRARFSEKWREEIWIEIEKRLRVEHLQTAELDEESAILNLDGSSLLTHFRSAHVSVKDNGPGAGVEFIDGVKYQTVNGRRRKITCEDGGCVGGKRAPIEKRGHGWNLVMISTSTGVPLAWRVVPLHHGESTVALDLVRTDFKNDVAPHLSPKLRVLSSDGAFHNQELRAELRKLGIVENIHLVSHADGSKKRAAEWTEKTYSIEGYPNWHANFHREIFCRCGKGVARRIKLAGDATSVNRPAIVRVEGKCSSCGTISLRSGDWRLSTDSSFKRNHPDDVAADRDWEFGNPLTFNDPMANEYGNDRFGHNEGLHGTLSTRYGLIRNKRWFRRKSQATIETAMTFALMHALAIEQRKLAREAAPPGELLAA